MYVSVQHLDNGGLTENSDLTLQVQNIKTRLKYVSVQHFDNGGLTENSDLTLQVQNLKTRLKYAFVQHQDRGVEILKYYTCPRASYLKKVTCPDKFYLSCFLHKHLILTNTVAKLNLFILSITSLRKI